MDKHPIRTSTSMKKAKIMDKRPICTSTSMKRAQIMDKHPIRTSTSMKKAQIMDKHSTRTSQSKPQFDDFYYISKNGRFDKSAISGVRSLQPEGIPPETVARCIGLPVEEVKTLHEKV